jgi:hypothetical protein
MEHAVVDTLIGYHRHKNHPLPVLWLQEARDFASHLTQAISA